jgi:hypothetical protein
LFHLGIPTDCATGLPDLQHPRRLNDRRLPLPFGKFGRFGPVGVYASEPFAILVKDGDLPVFMFAPLVFSELGTLSSSFGFWHKVRLSQSREARASTYSINNLQGIRKRLINGLSGPRSKLPEMSSGQTPNQAAPTGLARVWNVDYTI